MSRSFVSFYLDDQLFGIDIVLVREINRFLEMTPVPLATEYIRGLINLRGQIVTVLDLKQRLGLGVSRMTEVSHNIILKTESELTNLPIENEKDDLSVMLDKASFLVDHIGDVITVESNEIVSPPANIGSVNTKYLCGVLKLENTLLGILSVPKILNEKVD